MTSRLELIFRSEFERVRAAEVPRDEHLALLADMARRERADRCQAGGLRAPRLELQRARHRRPSVRGGADDGRARLGHPDRDVFFSSKGHDVPGLYAVLHSLGVIPTDRLLSLRRLGGLDGHPDVGVPGIEANSGSLGMGVSKGRGIAWAKRFLGRGGRVVVMTGDGELQEGQNWEAFQAAAHERVGTLSSIVDRNELQSDKPTEEIMALGDLEAKLAAFGWHVEYLRRPRPRGAPRGLRGVPGAGETAEGTCRAHDQGCGVSRSWSIPRALADGGGTYRWHAGAPDDDAFAARRVELAARIAERCERAGLPRSSSRRCRRSTRSLPRASRASPKRCGCAAARRAVTDEYVAEAYGEALLELAAERSDLVVLDADLASDCRVRAFELALSRAVRRGRHRRAGHGLDGGGHGAARAPPRGQLLCEFLASRANEQIYNQASERSKVIYALHYAGLIPAGPGQVAPEPPRRIVARGDPRDHGRPPRERGGDPCDAALGCQRGDGPSRIRLAIGPSPRRIELHEG